MASVDVQIEIDAPVERVWDVVMDPQRLGDWVTIHRAVKNASSQPAARGATMQQVLHVRGVSFQVQWTLISVSAPTRAEWEGRGPARSHARIRYELSSEGERRTLFKYTNEFLPPGGRLGMVASRVIMGATSEREATKSLAQLKKVVERS